MQPITALVLDRIIAFIAPLFLAEAAGDPQAARMAAAEVLLAYGAQTEPEIRMVALFISFSQRALDALARAAEPGLDVRTLLRLNSSATALSRAAFRCQKELDKLRARTPAGQTEPAISPAEADAALSPIVDGWPPPAPDLSQSVLSQSVLSQSVLSESVPANAVQNATVQNATVRGATAPASAPTRITAPACALTRQQRRAAERLALKEIRRQHDRSRLADRTTQPDVRQQRQAAA